MICLVLYILSSVDVLYVNFVVLRSEIRCQLTKRTLDFDGVCGLDRLTSSHGVLGGHTEVVAVALKQLGCTEAEGRGVEVTDGRPACSCTCRVTSLYQVPGNRRSAVHIRWFP